MRNFGYFEGEQVGSLTDVRLWRRILGYVRHHAPRLGLALVLALLVTAASLWLPRLMQAGIDRYITAQTLDPATRIQGLGRIAAVYAALVVFIFVAGFLQTVVLERVGQAIMHGLRQQLFAHMLRLDMNFFNHQPAGRLVTRLTNDIQNMHEMFTSVLVTLVGDLLKLGGIVGLLFWMNARLASLMALFLPLSLVMTMVFSRLARERFRAIRTQLARLNSFLQEALSGVHILQLFGAGQRSMEKYHRLNTGYLHCTLAQIRLFAVFMPLTELMGTVAVAAILWYGGHEILETRLTFGELAAFLSYMRLFFQPIRELSQKYSIVQSALASAERIFALLDTRPTIETVPAAPGVTRPVRPPRIRGRIFFEHVAFGYQEEELVLRDFNLEVRAGESIALVGSTGAGKSTILSLLVRLHDPLRGRILLDGVDLRVFDLHYLRRVIGVILQEVFILPDSLEANIVLDDPLDRDRLARVIRLAGMEEFVAGLPDGLKTRIGETGRTLSVGEKQMLGFARIHYRNPAVLIFDEATASVDTQTENLLEQAMDKAFQGRTSIIIAHRLSTIRRVDRVVVMDRGQIVEQGSHDELMARRGSYYHLVQLDMQPLEKGASG
ncbi:xenobiotic ABC transporter ATP-binding protein [Desulfolithobacter dissulfuricans]|uniref:Xenobiotic ABC transporter ATP-binding protein n=1 Tax=Desulfolithobacter dissulfuricans TaxID=2795293 RepID=A0A915XHW4_9BACT|nr:ABC transporter ATP-binding protein [Desulfolithobacter dissulfuricans]BCO09139.1 xenobiotic ABC transporter ATP-binding protein [Desulfolithobacter dissulfuricans]